MPSSSDRIRILFVSDAFPATAAEGGYHGGGWISSLIPLAQEAGFDIALAGLSTFPLPRESRLAKWGRYLRGRERDYSVLDGPVREFIRQVKPDLIYLFGIESSLCGSVLNGAGDIPVAVHLQGLLTAVEKAYYPPGFSAKTFSGRFSVRETLLHNGFGYAYRVLVRLAEREPELIKRVSNFLGRTDFDRSVVQHYHPEARYFTVNEVLREPFYAYAGAVSYTNKPVFGICSILSGTAYKGLDVVLKTARLLRESGFPPFVWRIAGIGSDDPIIGFFERATGVRSGEVGIRYDGTRTAEQLCDDLLGADVYVHPSYIDNSPNSVCEAQMLGVPVVATRVGGLESLVRDEETGLLIPSNGIQELAEALRRLQDDTSLRERLGKAGAAAAAVRHDKAAVREQLETAVKTILNHE